MDYGSLIRDAWTLTWRHRFLWVLGLFATSTVGTCAVPGGGGPQVSYEAGAGDVERLLGSIGIAMAEVPVWIAANLGLLLAAAGLVVLIGLALIVLSLVAQGGMAEATVALARGRPITPGQAWAAGRRLFWRYLGLWLLLLAAGLVVSVVVGALVGLAIAVASLATGPRIVLTVLLVLVAVPLVLAAIPVAIALSIVVAYAQRAIAAEDLDALGALRAGWELLRQHVGDTLLAWLVNLGLGIGAGLAIGVAVVGVVAVLAVPGAIVWALLGLPATIVYGAIGLVLLIAAVWLLSAVANTFFWSYWTLVYVRLSAARPA